MGAALWKLATDEAELIEVPEYLPPPKAGCRYRIEVFGEPRTPWRSSPAEAMADAIALELASFDPSKREHFLAVPVEMRALLPTPASAALEGR